VHDYHTGQKRVSGLCQAEAIQKVDGENREDELSAEIEISIFEEVK